MRFVVSTRYKSHKNVYFDLLHGYMYVTHPRQDIACGWFCLNVKRFLQVRAVICILEFYDTVLIQLNAMVEFISVRCQLVLVLLFYVIGI
jgi:hypothetical protein